MLTRAVLPHMLKANRGRVITVTTSLGTMVREGYLLYGCSKAAAEASMAVLAADLAGTAVLVGVPDPSMVFEIPLIEVFGHGGAVKSSWYGDCLPERDFPLLVELWQQGRFPLDRFVSERIALDDVEEAFHKMERGEVLRSVVVL